MARSLNRKRILISWVVGVSGGLLFLFSRGLWQQDTLFTEVNEMIGYVVVTLCAFGRVYCTAYIGGRKNQALVQDGPFSLCRNPLYFCSLLGILGIALMSNRITLIIGLMGAFLFIYHRLIQREEAFLRQTFGEEYEAYCRRTPRLIPRLENYSTRNEINVRSQFLLKSIGDAVVWFLPLPCFELISTLQQAGHLPVFFLLP
jgi:protein-S-isoprenylcysteine O-methyltransferase Ste14